MKNYQTETPGELMEMTAGKTLAQLQTELEYQQSMGETLGGNICSHIVYEMEKLRYAESLQNFRFQFKGRQTGAIGIFYNISHCYKAETLSDALKMLWTDYEHISNLTAFNSTGDAKKIDADILHSTKLSNTIFPVSVNRK